MTEYLLRSITKGKFEEWHPESFPSLEAVCEQVEDWAERTGDDVPELHEAYEMDELLNAHGSHPRSRLLLDRTPEVREMLKQRDLVRMEKEYMKHDNDRNYSFETFCELNARY